VADNTVVCINCRRVGPPPGPPALSCCPERKEVSAADVIGAFAAILPAHKCGLYITHNEHRDVYETVEEHLEHLEVFGAEDVVDRDTMIATGEVWRVQVYPHTPVGFYAFTGPTLEAVLLRCLEDSNG